tara:strand:- start:43 stop:255 length:213 start_codon:yes stop_codon:yes gene_type:complete
MQLPLCEEKLTNFIFNHIHEWSKEYIELNECDRKANGEEPDHLGDVMNDNLNSLFENILDDWNEKRREFN